MRMQTFLYRCNLVTRPSLCGLVIMCFLVQATMLHASEREVSKDIDGLNVDLDSLENDHENLPVLVEKLDPETWLRRAKIAMSSGQLDAASMLFYAATEAPAIVTSPKPSREIYLEGLEGLAETLYLSNNLKASEYYFQKLLAEPSHNRHDVAMTRLVELALRLHRKSKVGEYYTLYKKNSGRKMPAEVSYAIGRSFFLEGLYADAEKRMSSIPKETPFYLRSQYILGAILVQNNKVEEGLNYFKQVLANATVVVDEDLEVLELLHLSVARLHYENNEITEALDAYQNIGIDSKYLAEMLYESVWAQVQRGQEIREDSKLSNVERHKLSSDEFGKAIERLGYLKYLEGDPIRSAENELLLGHLQILQGDIDGASDSFTQVVDEYRSAHESLQEILSDSDKQSFVLEDILAIESGEGNIGTSLPVVAARFAVDNPEVKKALRVYRELNETETQVDDAQSAWSRISSLIERKDRGQLFPGMNPAYRGAHALDMRLADVEGDVLQMKRDLSVKKMTPDQRSSFLQRKVATDRLRKQMLDNLLTGAELNRAVDSWNDNLTGLDQKLAKIRLQLRGFERTVNVLDEDLRHQHEKAARDPVMVEKFRRELRYWDEQHRMMQWLERELTEQVRWERQTLKMTEGRGSYQTELRKRYLAALDSEKKFLKKIHGAWPAKVAAYEKDLHGMRRRVDAFTVKIDKTVTRQLQAYIKLLDNEKGNLNGYREGLSKIRHETDRFKRATTQVAIRHIQYHLKNMVMRGDVGLLDVLWSRKQRNTDQISDLQRTHSRSLMGLEQTYLELQSGGDS